MNRQELLKALEIVKPGLASKDMIEQATCFAFMDGHVVTYNDEISIRHPIDIGVTGAVKAEELHGLLSKLKPEEIDIEAGEGEIQIKAGRTSAGLTMHCEIRLPLEELGENGDWKNVPEGFVEGASFCLFSCSKDMSRPTLTCVHINKEIVESCDNMRMTRYTLNKPFPIASLLIPASSLAEILKYPIMKVSQSKGWVHFKSKLGTVISARVFEDNYVDLTPFINHGQDSQELKMPASIESTLERAGIFAKSQFDSDQLVSMTMADKRMTVAAKNDAGWISEQLNMSYSGDPISFSIHPRTLQDILKKTSKFRVTDSVIEFGGDNWVHIAALLAESEKKEEKPGKKKKRGK